MRQQTDTDAAQDAAPVLKALSTNMIFSNENKVRPKFLGLVLLILGCILLIGGIYTAGLWLPFFGAAVFLIITKSDNVIEILPIRAYQLIFWAALILGLALHLALGHEEAISWYLLAFLLSLSFKIVRSVLSILGLLGLFTSA